MHLLHCCKNTKTHTHTQNCFVLKPISCYFLKTTTTTTTTTTIITTNNCGKFYKCDACKLKEHYGLGFKKKIRNFIKSANTLFEKSKNYFNMIFIVHCENSYERCMMEAFSSTLSFIYLFIYFIFSNFECHHMDFYGHLNFNTNLFQFVYMYVHMCVRTCVYIYSMYH